MIAILYGVPGVGTLGAWFCPRTHWEAIFDRVWDSAKAGDLSGSPAFWVQTAFPYPDGLSGGEDPIGVRMTMNC